ncbi:hypothetical protein P3S68_031190 [Capsicum galapagoense]
MIGFIQSSNLVVRGLRVQNSPMFHMIFDECEGVLIDQLSISSPKLSPNTDGIHIENTKSVGIYNSVIATGDDCMSIGPDSSNINIEGVICGPSHGISIGILGMHHSQACVSNIMVHNTIIRHSDNGVQIKTWRGGSGSVTGLSFDTIQMENVLNCIIIDQYYCYKKAVRMRRSPFLYVTSLIETSRAPTTLGECSYTLPLVTPLPAQILLCLKLNFYHLKAISWLILSAGTRMEFNKH